VNKDVINPIFFTHNQCRVVISRTEQPDRTNVVAEGMELICVQVQWSLLSTGRGRFAGFFGEADCVKIVERFVAKPSYEGTEGCCTSLKQLKRVFGMHP
jgi:hypothetical protein